MPELPEVETVLRGITPHVIGQEITDIVVRRPALRWPIPQHLSPILCGEKITAIVRRGKYLIFQFKPGSLILHLGMSGRLCVMPEIIPHQKHDHVDICLSNNTCLRFTDPRRFGALLWTPDDPNHHHLIASIGPEPLSTLFNTAYFLKKTRKRSAPIKTFIMDSKVVAGVGNIYAAEALFLAGIKPQKAAGKLSLTECETLVAAIKKVLRHAIKKGGTTLKDYVNANGAPGYFRIELKVYGRGGEPCVQCGVLLVESRMGQRSTVYCGVCQR